jgi:hypothetical protein
MQSDKITEKVLALYPEVFEALEEYDKTHRLKKINYKERANFTVDSDILRRFRKYCKKNSYSMSAKIESFMSEETKNLQ